MSLQLVKWSTGITLFLWLLWVFITYLGFHPEHYELFINHPYGGFIVVFLLVLAILSWWSFKQLKSRKKWTLSIRGVYLIGIGFLFAMIVLFQFRSVINLDRTAPSAAGIMFLANSLWYLLLLLILGLGLFALGNTGRKLTTNIPENSLLTIAIGCLLLVLISTLLGLAGMLYGIVLWGVLIAALIWQARASFELLKNWTIKKHSWRIYKWWEPSVALLGILFVAVYWLGALKAFPTGFDGAALYANLAKLIPEYHALPGSYHPFSWSLVMSWGQLLFGSLTFSLLLAHLMFLPALALAYQISRSWLKTSYALLASVFVASMPMLAFQTMVDEKIDLGLLFISLAVVYLALNYQKIEFQPKQQWSQRLRNPGLRVLFLLGLLLGFCFTIKYTSLFLLAGTMGFLFWQIGRQWLFWSWIAFFFGLVFLSGFYILGNIPIVEEEARWLGVGGLILGSGAMIYYFIRQKEQWQISWQTVLAVAIGFMLSFSPWAGKNLAENNYTFSISNLLYGAPDQVTIDIPPNYFSGYINKAPSVVGKQRDFIMLTSDKGQKQKAIAPEREEKAPVIGNAKREELQRYLGYEEGIWRYLTIPFDLTFGINIPGLRHQDIGFLFLILLPLLFYRTAEKSNWWRNSLVTLFILLLIPIFFWTFSEADSATDHIAGVNAKMDIYWGSFSELRSDRFPQLWRSIQVPFVQIGTFLLGPLKAVSKLPAIVFIPLILLIFPLLTSLMKHRFVKWKPIQQGAAILLLGFAIFWVLLGNSISWYAMIMWTLLPFLMFYYLQEIKDFLPSGDSRLVRYGVGIIIAIQLLVNLGIVFSSSQPNQLDTLMFNWPMVEYACRSDMDQGDALALFDPTSQNVVEILNRDKDAKIYRINTYLQFHIDKNDQRVYEDNQLQRYAEMLNNLKQPSNFLDVLKENGITYILYDLNSPSLDQTPEQSLRQKCNSLMTLLLQESSKVELSLTDNYVEAPGAPLVLLPNGQQVAAQRGLIGKTLYRGRVALFHIK